jgi:hypothetical protein
VDAEGLVTAVRGALYDMGLLERGDRIVESGTVRVPYAYPVATPGTDAARDHLLTTFESRDISCAGRFGEWLYINSDDALMRGRARAEALSGPA